MVVDRSRVSGGGVTAGIDFALTLAAEVAGPTVAQTLQLLLEYNPAPPFNCGSPAQASPAVRAQFDALIPPQMAALHDYLNTRSAGQPA